MSTPYEGYIHLDSTESIENIKIHKSIPFYRKKKKYLDRVFIILSY